MSLLYPIVYGLALVWAGVLAGCVVVAAVYAVCLGCADAWKMWERAWWRWWEPRSARWHRAAAWQVEIQLEEQEGEMELWEDARRGITHPLPKARRAA